MDDYDQYASHLPVLSRIISAASRIESILEVGAGFYSTPMLNAFAVGAGCDHVVLESDKTWRDNITQWFDIKVQMFDLSELPQDILDQRWSLVFIDCQDERSRSRHALALKNMADMIVLHDSNPDWDHAYKYSEIIPLWKYSHQFTATYPHSLLLTNDQLIWEAISKEYGNANHIPT